MYSYICVCIFNFQFDYLHSPVGRVQILSIFISTESDYLTFGCEEDFLLISAGSGLFLSLPVLKFGYISEIKRILNTALDRQVGSKKN